MRVLTANQMQTVDRRSIEEIGIPGVVLMENAGRGVAEALIAHLGARINQGILILAGKGNNGGDGYVVARNLQNRGYLVETWVLAAERSQVKGDAAINLNALLNCGGKVRFLASTQEFAVAVQTMDGYGVLVDALFGTGLAKAVKGVHAEVIEWINRRPEPVVAVDIPSGIDASTGRVLGTCVDADLTVTFAFPKVGLVSYPGAGHVGDLVTIDIGIPKCVADTIDSDCILVDAAEAISMLPQRPTDGHKGTFGHLLVIAGSVGKTGAAVMAAEAGLRGGAGLVTLACAAHVQPVVAAHLTEVMTVPLIDVNGEVSLQALDDLVTLAADKQALAIGPGLGLGEETGALVRRLLQDCPLPVAVDADGLTALSGFCDVLLRRQGGTTVLSPHPGEMARLNGLTVAEIQANRIEVARDFARQYGVVLILKGARTVTATPAGRVYINRSGHAGLASGGMGDVLTGLVGSLLAQGVQAETAAPLAVYLHGYAADRLLPVFGDAGLLATDVLRELPSARKALIEEK